MHEEMKIQMAKEQSKANDPKENQIKDLKSQHDLVGFARQHLENSSSDESNGPSYKAKKNKARILRHSQGGAI